MPIKTEKKKLAPVFVYTGANLLCTVNQYRQEYGRSDGLAGLTNDGVSEMDITPSYGVEHGPVVGPMVS